MSTTSPLKIIFWGPTQVGKSKLIKRIFDNEYTQNSQPTIGVEYCSFNRNYPEVEAWDTAGQERYSHLWNSYLKQADILVVVLDVSDEEGLKKLEPFLVALQKHKKSMKHLILVGNKADLFPQISKAQLEECMSKQGITRYSYVSSSAKSGAGIEVLKAVIDNKIVLKMQRDINTHQPQPAPTQREQPTGYSPSLLLNWGSLLLGVGIACSLVGVVLLLAVNSITACIGLAVLGVTTGMVGAMKAYGFFNKQSGLMTDEDVAFTKKTPNGLPEQAIFKLSSQEFS